MRQTDPADSADSRRQTDSESGLWMTALIMLLLAALFPAAGCRVPAPPVLLGPKTGMVYDTSYEREVKSGKVLPVLLDGVWEPYFETLAEPVAVTEWRDSTSTWSVFFATNRAPEHRSHETSSPAFGNAVLDKVVLGQASVILPHRQRGEEPVRSRPGKLRLASLTRWKSSEAERS